MTAFQPGDRVHLKGHVHTPATTGTVTGTTPEGRIFVRWDNDNWVTTPHYPQHLEPAGEPMSKRTDFFAEPGSHNPEPKTFRSVIQDDESSRTLQIQPWGTAETIDFGIYDGPKLCGIHISATDAPAMALAILEAAGLENVPHDSANGAEKALGYLIEYVGLQRANAKAAADREALEREALTLCRVMWGNPAQQWAPMSDKAKETWSNLARKARELHGVTK